MLSPSVALSSFCQRCLRALSGLLLDDMGLGKSLQTIALILSSSGRDFFPGAADALAQQPAPGVRSSTLIVAPLSVLSSWEVIACFLTSYCTCVLLALLCRNSSASTFWKAA